MRKTLGDRARASLAIVFLMLLVVSPSASIALSPAPAVSASPGVAHGDYALASYETSAEVNLTQLQRLTGGHLDVPSFESAIVNHYLSLDIRRVVLDIGWQDYPVGALPMQQWVDDWLTACDQMGVQNLLLVGQLTKSGIGSPWVESLFNADPTTRTYNSDGQPTDYIAPDNPDVAMTIESDLLRVHSYYGSHLSLVGLTTGYPSSDPYYADNSTVPDVGYSNSTLQNFANSLYYERDVNSSGYLPSGALDKLWTSFRSVEPSVIVSSGIWMLSSDFHVYGTGANKHSVGMMFDIPRNESGITISWYGSKVGHPGQMTAAVYPVVNGTTASAAEESANASEDSSSSSASLPGWQTPIQLTGNLTAGRYWLLLTTQSGDSSNYYNVFLRDYILPGAYAAYILPPGGGSQGGSTILWVRNSNGTDVAVYPFQNALVNPPSVQTFVASGSFSFNTVFLFVSDREYDPTNGTLSIIDLSANKTMAEGLLSQSLTRGLQNWVPVTLDANVTTTALHKYEMVVSEPNNGYSWRVILRGLSVDPPEAGFQGEGSYWLFRLASLKWSQSQLDFAGVTSNGHDAIANGKMDAVRFTPSEVETVKSVSFLTKNLQPTGANYSGPGSLMFQIWTGNQSSLNPAGPALQSVSVPLSQVPQNGWLNVTGFDLQVTKDVPYWVVISSNSSQAVSLARLTSPYRFLVQVSSNGQTWSNPSEGPTEFSFEVSTTGEIIGNFINDIKPVTINQASWLAQPIELGASTQVQGVYLGGGGFGVRSSSGASSYLQVSINPDNGKGQPSSNMLASGTYPASNITYVSPDLVPFSSVARLEAGQRYWIVVQAFGGNYYVAPVQYERSPSGYSGNFTTLVSTDGGYGWAKLSNSTTVLSYALESPIEDLPTYSTAQLFDDLAMNHNYIIEHGILQGWNAYIQSSELMTYQRISSYVLNQTGQKWDFYATTDNNLLSQLAVNLLIPIAAPIGGSACSDLVARLQSALATTSEQFVPISNAPATNCEGNLQDLSSQLGSTRFLGGEFGSSTATKVLLVGMNTTDSTGLSNLFNVTYVDEETDPGLSSAGPLANYQAIVWLASNSSTGVSLGPSLHKYASAGGLLLVFRSPSAWMRELIGFDWTNVSGAVNSTVPSDVRAAYSALAVHTDYNYTSLLRVGNSTYVGTSGQSILSINQLGKGEVAYFDPAPGDTLDHTISDASVLLANLVFQFLGNGSGPLWSDPTAAAASPLEVQILGKHGGSVVISAFNPTHNALPFQLNLNGTYFGVSKNWTLYYTWKLSSSAGSGGLVKITSVVNPSSWEPIVLVPRWVNMTLQYSNLQVVRTLAYPNQLLVTLTGHQNQEAVAAISSLASVNSVLIDDHLQLTRFGSVQNLANNSRGWFYDSATNTLLIRYVANGTDSVRVLLNSPVFVAATIPYGQLGEYFAVFLVADVTVVAVLWLRHRKH